MSTLETGYPATTELVVHVTGCSQPDYYYYDDDLTATYRFETVVRAVVPAIFSIIALVGLAGNLLVIIVVASNRQMRNTTNVLIINLAAADLLFIVICVPFTAIGYAIPVWPFGDGWCKIYQYVVHVTAYASVYTLVMMSFDRYLAVVHPVRSMTWRTGRNASIVATASWVLILGVNVPVIVEHRTVVYHFDGQERSACLNALIYNDDDPATTYYHGRVYYACFFAFAYVVPLAMVSVLYGLMVKRLLYGATPGSGKAAGESMRGKRRVTRLVIVVVVIFALCWLPLQLVLVIQFVGHYTDHNFAFVAAKIACSCLAYMNSCVNPILYAFLSDNFRKSFRRFLCVMLCTGCAGCRRPALAHGAALLPGRPRMAKSEVSLTKRRSIALSDLGGQRVCHGEEEDLASRERVEGTLSQVTRATPRF